jgi:hypothetical protein
MNTESALLPGFKITLPKTMCQCMGWVIGQEVAVLPHPQGLLLVNPQDWQAWGLPPSPASGPGGQTR